MDFEVDPSHGIIAVPMVNLHPYEALVLSTGPNLVPQADSENLSVGLVLPVDSGQIATLACPNFKR